MAKKSEKNLSEINCVELLFLKETNAIRGGCFWKFFTCEFLSKICPLHRLFARPNHLPKSPSNANHAFSPSGTLSPHDVYGSSCVEPSLVAFDNSLNVLKEKHAGVSPLEGGPHSKGQLSDQGPSFLKSRTASQLHESANELPASECSFTPSTSFLDGSDYTYQTIPLDPLDACYKGTLQLGCTYQEAKPGYYYNPKQLTDLMNSKDWRGRTPELVFAQKSILLGNKLMLEVPAGFERIPDTADIKDDKTGETKKLRCQLSESNAKEYLSCLLQKKHAEVSLPKVVSKSTIINNLPLSKVKTSQSI